MKKTHAEKHNCFKNWSGSSSGMEADILVDGFFQSVPMYGLKFSKFIGDGDSNFYKKILDSRPYTNMSIEKIECKNHLLRNACNKLKDLARNSQFKHVTLRKIVGDKIMRVRTAVCMAVKFRKGESGLTENEKIRNLRKDILNIPNHVYGHHNECSAYFCKRQKFEKDFTTMLKNSGLFCKIMEVMHRLADNAKSLLFDMSSNAVESFNSIIAKFVGGKRINYCLRRSYQARCNAAVVSHNAKMPFYALHKNLLGNSPGIYSKLSEKRRTVRRLAKRENNYKRKRLFCENNDGSYGKYAERPDMDLETFNTKKDAFLSELKKNAKEIDNIMAKTISQRSCMLWKEERRKRLTASNFGNVCKRLPYTKCDSLVRNILYSNFENDAMRYGQAHEKDAIMDLSKLGVIVKPCGLIIDEELPFLAASPDGIIDDETILEIKCPAACADFTPEEAIILRKTNIWLKNKKNNEISFNKNHRYYYQVQGQMHISKKKYCLFAFWTPKGLKIEKIEKDNLFWENKMKKKLTTFYYDCLLPEILDPRITRSLPIRNPQYILDAIKLKEEKKLQNNSINERENTNS